MVRDSASRFLTMRVKLLPRMMGRNNIDTPKRSRDAEYARVLSSLTLDKKKRAQGMPDAQCTRSLACECKKHTSIVTTGTPKRSGTPCANGFNGFLRDLPGVRDFLVTVIGAMPSIVANLTPAKGRQDHTTSPSASTSLVWRLHASTASCPTFRDDWP